MASHRQHGRASFVWLALFVITGGAAVASVEHLAARTVAEVGRTRVIAFRLDVPAVDDRALPVEVGDPGVLVVVLDPAVKAGETFGYVRVRGLAAGTTDLVIGDASLVVEVVAPRAPGSGDERPVIVGPSTGAVIWGAVSIGVQVRIAPGMPLPRVMVRAAGAAGLDPVSDTERRHPPWRHLRFELDASALPAGELRLVPVVIGSDGRERAGSPVVVRVAHPDEADVTAGEAETRYDVERPPRFDDARMSIGRDRAASGGAFFSNAGAEPAVCFPVVAAETGWYQVMLVAGGSRGQGALPTVGIVVDGADESVTNGCLLADRWHRLAVGVPFRLEAGPHVISPLFANDFYVRNLADRNLSLDRIEVARVPEAAVAVDLEYDDPCGLRRVPVRVGLVRVLDGGTLPGLIEVEGRCGWDGADTAPAPVVTLFVNDRPVLTQRSGAPRFLVDPSLLAAGENRFQLAARLDGGAVVRTPVQTMRWPAAAGDGRRRPARVHRRFSIHDERWDPSVAERLRGDHHPAERRSAAFSSNGSASLALSEELAGSFDVFIEARGDLFEGPPIATVELRVGHETTEVGTVAVPGWWDRRRAGTVEIAAGMKDLVVSYRNDHSVEGAGDRNLWLQAVVLVQRPVVDDVTPPLVTIAYPPDGHAAWMTDAVVADASDDASLADVQLVIDGVETGLAVQLNLRPGRVVLPLLLRGMEPGEHTFELIARDVVGNSARSERRTFVVLPGPPDEPGPYERALHLLDRFGYGPDAGALGAILTQGGSAWLRACLEKPFDDPAELTALGAGLPYFDRGRYGVPRRALAHLLLTPNPVRARFVIWAENHFSTWLRKVDGIRKWDEHIAFSRLGPAPFADLLTASAESPAMLAYLDQETSFAGRINENYAREIMELHTLGVDGGYGQADVTSLAHLLTGWTASAEGDGRGGGDLARTYTFRFDPALSGGAATTVIGMDFPSAARSGRYDRMRLAIETLAAHPSTARFVSRKLADHYASQPPPESLVEDLTRVFVETAGDMTAMLLALAEHPAFWSRTADRVAHPIDFGVRACRVMRHFQPWQLGDFLNSAGTGLFDCASPDGYPEDDAAYADSNAMLQRWKLARRWQWPLAGLVPGPWRYSGEMPESMWAQSVADVVAVRLTGRVLGDASNESALRLLEESAGTRDERVRLVATFIAQLPEASLR